MKPLIAILLAILGYGICTAPVHADPTPKPKPGKTAQAQLPVAVPVPGKPGLVYSPYAKGKIMDVEPYKHGEVVICPYTNKKFRVP